MDKVAKNSELFRSIPVHSQKLGAKRGLFRSISVHYVSDHERDDAFPEHIHSIVGQTYSDVLRHSPIFRSISVHYSRFFSYLCTGINNRTSTTMAGTVKDMSLIKQVLQLKQLGESNRGISRKLPIDKETVNIYVRTMRANGWGVDELLRKDDPELERMFHTGSPAYSDPHTGRLQQGEP